ncbi:hypothetical protein [Roseibium album]|uniref:hypothetical protein n=1 Tax=Roseibium album TaxID=311410 RepID=UPI00329A37D1
MDQQRFENLDDKAKANAVLLYESGVERFDHHPMDGLQDLWKSFNNWLSCVTAIERDANQIQDFVGDKEIQQLFEELWKNDNTFRERLLAFSAEWPIYKSSSILKHYGAQYPWQFSTRAELLVAIAGDPRLIKSPRDWVPGSNPTLSQTIWAIYQVRGNLIHGRKNAHVEDDVRLVQMAFNVLIKLIDDIGYADPLAESP